MKFLYIFPHPDDESFGPSPVIRKQVISGHDVHILTLTLGGATKQRHKLGLDVEAMGQVRKKEMEAVRQILQPASWTMWNLPDGGLTALNPLELEHKVENHIRSINPEILVTYPQHGISGHPDHLVIHAIVKRIFSVLKKERDTPCRLAFFTLPPEENPGNPRAHFSPMEDIDCIISLDDYDREILRSTLYCYQSYLEIVEGYNVLQHIGNRVCFEIWDENFEPKLTALEAELPG